MIKVGITELHGIAKEISKFPPDGVVYIPIQPVRHFTDKLITSTAKGVLRYFSCDEVDIIEAPIFPILTKQKWIYTPADFATCANFQLMHIPLPRPLRIFFLKKIFSQKNFVKLLFKSNAGRNTLMSYGKLDSTFLSEKVDVVYPAVRRVENKYIKFNKDKVNLLFVGDFFAKGGIHVVDAFEKIQKEFPNGRLRICSHDAWQTNNYELAKRYKSKVVYNENITFDYVDRDILIEKILPETDIFLCPTYRDSYGYAIEEAMAYAIPVISTNHFAIPEIVEHGVSGFLIRTQSFEFVKNFKNYRVDYLPADFHSYMNSEVYKYLRLLVSNFDLRREMGLAGLQIARSKFSFERRNAIMKKVYESALEDG